MNLAVFDVDGTLTQTSEVDGACFERALREALGLDGFPTDWSLYEHATDSGIVEEACRRCHGRGLAPVEAARMQHRFMALLTAERAVSPASFAATPGADAALRRLAAAPEWRVAVATGCWRGSAMLKLAAGLPDALDWEAVPFACADDCVARTEIVETAVARARAAYGEMGRAVYVGDALWDVRACAELRLPFVGIGRGERASRLLAAGASHVLPDFLDTRRLFESLEQARPPATARRSFA